MKLIIDIPDHIYSMVTNTGTFGCYRFNTSKAIRQGVPLDKIRAEIDEIPLSKPIISADGLYCYGSRSISMGHFRGENSKQRGPQVQRPLGGSTCGIFQNQ